MNTFGGDDKTGYAGAIVWAAGGVTKEELDDGSISINGGYSGGTLTKPLILFRSPVELLEAATKSYVDSTVGVHSSDTDLHIDAATKALLGAINVSAAEVNSLSGLTYNVNLEMMRKIDRSGDTMTGMFTLFSDPVDNLHAATKQYVDSKLSVELTNLSNNKVNKYGDTMTGLLSLSGNPTANLHAVTKQYVDVLTNGLNNRVTTTENALFTLNQDPVTKAYVDTAVALKLNKAGDTMTGLLTLSGAPTGALHATTKTYVDTADNLRLSKSGGTMTGAITLSGAPTAALHAVTKAYVDTADSSLNTRLTTAEGAISGLVSTAATKTYVDTQDATKVNKTGDTMFGLLTLSGNPATALHAATKVYVDTADSALNSRLVAVETTASGLGMDPVTKTYVDAQDAAKLAVAGGTMTGALTLSGAPTQALHPATKSYVDTGDVALSTRLSIAETTLSRLSTDPVSKGYVDTQDGLKVSKAGDTMTGALTLSGAPTVNLHAASKLYVDSQVAVKVNKSGDTFTGPLILNSNPVSNLEAATKQYVDGRVNKAGDVMTGALTLSGAPISDLHAATKRYVDLADNLLDLRLVAAEGAIVTFSTDPVSKTYVDNQLALRVPFSGGTLTGALTLSGDPVSGLHPATKQYVDVINTTLDTRIDILEGSVSSLNSDPVTKAYVDAADALKLNKAGDTMTGLLTLSGTPTAGLHAATKQYVDTGLTTHISDSSLHLTSSQNTFLDTVSVTATEVNRLAGVSSGVQGQIDSKLSLSGGTLTGTVILSPGYTLTINTAPVNGTDAVNKTYVDDLIQGMKWKAPIVDSNLIGININTPPGAPTAGHTYAIGGAPTGVWTGLAGRLVTYSGAVWVDVLGRALQVGDRLGVGFEVNTSVLDASVSIHDNKLVRVNSVSPTGLIVEASSLHDTTLVADSESKYYGSVYSYTDTDGWVKVTSSLVYSAGIGLTLNNSVFSVNLSSGLEEVVNLGVSSVKARTYPNGGIILTQDGVLPSNDSSAGLAVSVDTTSVVISGGKIAVKPTILSSLAAKLDRAGDTMTGALTLSGAPTLGGHATTKSYVDSADSALSARLTTAEGTISVLNTDATTKTYVDTQDATKVDLAGASMTGLLTLSGAPIVALHAATKSYVDIGDNLRVAIAGGTMTGLLTLSGDPVSNLHASTKQYADTKLSKSGGTMTGALVLSSNPTAALQATTKQYVDTADSALDSRLTTAESTVAALNSNPVTKTYVDTQDATKLALAGGTMTGLLTLSGVPTLALHASSKSYVDGQDALKVAKSGDTMSGPLTLSADPVSNLQAATKQYVDVKLNKAGDTMTGMLTLFSNPSAGFHAATKTYVDAADSGLNTRLIAAETTIGALSSDNTTKTYVDTQDALRVAKTGDTMTGALTLSGAPTANLHATTKLYVDTADALLDARLDAAEATITSINNTYTTASYVNAADALKLSLTGGTMTGAITLSGAPTAGLHAATKTYVDAINTSLGGRLTTVEGTIATINSSYASTTYVDNQDALKLSKSGGTMTGTLVLAGTPVGSMDAVNKAYVDMQIGEATYLTVPSWNDTTNNQVGTGWNAFQIALTSIIDQNRNAPLSTLRAYTPSSSNFPSSSSFTNGVLLSDGSVFCAPYNSTSARIYDINTNQLITPNGSYPGSNSFCTAIMLKDGRVFMAPWNSTSARIYNPFTDSLVTPPVTFGGSAQYCDAVLLPDGRVFLVPYNRNTAAIFDPMANTLTDVPGVYTVAAGYSGGILLPDGRVFMVPHQATTARIYDPVSNITSVAAGTYPGNYAFNSGVVMADGRVFMVPCNSTTARIYDPVADTVSIPSGTYPGSNAFISCTLLLDGRVFMTPNNTANARVYDPYTNILTTLPDVYPTNSFANTVLLPDGRAMMVPNSTNRCRIINTTFMPVPMAICTSPFYNKK